MSRLAVPVVLAQVGLMLMGVVDTLMVGRVSAEALAAVALGNLYFTTLVVPASGTLMVLDAVVAQAVGARDSEGVARGVQRGFVLAMAIGLVASVVLLPVRPMLVLFHQPAALIPVARARGKLNGETTANTPYGFSTLFVRSWAVVLSAIS